MSKLKKLSKALQILIQKPYMINKVIDDENIHEEAILSSYPNLKNGFPVIDYLTLLPNFNESIHPFSFLNGGSLITDLALLKGLTAKVNNCVYFEIGTFRGESVANVANVAKSCFTLNLSNEALKKLGLDEEHIQQQEFFSKNIQNITHLKGNSFDFDFSPYYKKCDVVFIDGDHHYESVLNDTKIAFQLLKDENSVIVWHDYASQPGTIRWDVLRGIYEGTPANKRNKLFCVSNTLCAFFTEENLQHQGKQNISPTKVFNVNISAKKI